MIKIQLDILIEVCYDLKRVYGDSLLNTIKLDKLEKLLFEKPQKNI